MPHAQCGVGYNALDNKYASFSNIQVSTQLEAWSVFQHCVSKINLKFSIYWNLLLKPTFNWNIMQTSHKTLRTIICAIKREKNIICPQTRILEWRFQGRVSEDKTQGLASQTEETAKHSNFSVTFPPLPLLPLRMLHTSLLLWREWNTVATKGYKPHIIQNPKENWYN